MKLSLWQQDVTAAPLLGKLHGDGGRNSVAGSARTPELLRFSTAAKTRHRWDLRRGSNTSLLKAELAMGL